MGLNFMEIDPIPHLASPLKGEEQDKLALMRAGGNDVNFVLIDNLGLTELAQYFL